jgi:hypothetical protein
MSWQNALDQKVEGSNPSSQPPNLIAVRYEVPAAASSLPPVSRA